MAKRMFVAVWYAEYQREPSKPEPILYQVEDNEYAEDRIRAKMFSLWAANTVDEEDGTVPKPKFKKRIGDDASFGDYHVQAKGDYGVHLYFTEITAAEQM